VAGTGADMILRVNSSYLAQSGFLDSTPLTSNDIPATKQDVITMLEHEIGHGLGMTGSFSTSAD
jgi:hypothetical protein